MTTPYDLIVIGAGIIGSAAAYHAARQHQRTLLLEQFALDHPHGSSWGATRIIRYAYAKPEYVRLMRHAYAAWDALAEAAGEPFVIKTGGLDFGLPDDAHLQATLNSLRAEGIPHRVLSPAEAAEMFPQFRFDPRWLIVHQADAGIITPSRAVLAQARLAQQHGADLREHVRVLRIVPMADGITVETDAGDFHAARCIVAAGAWAGSLLREIGLELPLQPLQIQECLFVPPADTAHLYGVDHFPSYIYHRTEADSLYGIASYAGSGFKTAAHSGAAYPHPDDIPRTPNEAEVARIRAEAAPYLPAIARADLAMTRICLYTMTPDEDFILDVHPQHPRLTIAATCSGHAAKFGNLLGQMAVQLALEGATPYDRSLFGLARFGGDLPTGRIFAARR